MATEQDENILKSALAFVVLRRRLKARKSGLSFGSPLPFTQQSNRQQNESYNDNDNDNDNGNYDGDRNDDYEINEGENENVNVDIRAGQSGSLTLLSTSHDEDDDVDRDNDREEILPFLNGIDIDGFQNKTNGSENGETLSSSSNLSKLSQTPSSLTSPMTHISSMLRVAKSTSLSLYSSGFLDATDNANDNYYNQNCTHCATNDTGKVDKEKSKQNQKSSISGTRHDKIQHCESSSTQSSPLSMKNQFSLVYDFKTACMSKVVVTKSKKKQANHQQSSSFNSSSVSASSSSSIPNNAERKKSTNICAAQSSYAVLDGILLHITSQLRAMKQHHYHQQHQQHDSENGDNLEKTILNNTLYSFIIQNLLEPITVVRNKSHGFDNQDNQHHNCFQNHKHHSNNNAPRNNNAQRIQSILSICTILHRLVLFDTSLSLDIISILCDVLKCLYHGRCHERYIVDVLLTGYKNCNDNVGSDSVDDDGNSTDERNVEATTFMRSRRNGFSYYNHNNSERINQKRGFIDNDNEAESLSQQKSSDKFHSVQIEDVLAVNCLVLLEQVIGMSLSLGTCNNMTTKRIASQSKQNEIIGEVLSTLNSHLGPDLMIPVPTNDMACLFVTHERQKRNYQIAYNLQGGGMDRSDGNDVGVIYIQSGLNVGAKMMIRLYIYDIIKKLSCHNT